MTVDFFGYSADTEFSDLDSTGIDSRPDSLGNIQSEQGRRSPLGLPDTQQLLSSVIEAAASQLKQFSQSTQFVEGIQQAFGTNVDVEIAQHIVQDFISGNNRPKIQILRAEELGSEGAFGNNTVYLADSLLNPQQSSFEKAVAVLQEEIGHYLDTVLNPNQDTAGDEGAIFAQKIQGKSLSDTELAALKIESDHDILWVDGEAIAIERFSGETGVFKVGEAGQFRFDLLVDSGGYEGEIAFFSLRGMESFERGSASFIQEAARRALSNSELGNILFSDARAGARFTGELGEVNLNRGDYGGVQSFALTPGDEIAFILVPDGTLQEVLNNPTIGGSSKQPLFSLASANPNGNEQFGQLIADTINSGTFGFEDLSLAQGSDRDFNDLIFRIEGATGQGNY